MEDNNCGEQLIYKKYIITMQETNIIFKFAEKINNLICF